MAYKRRRTRTSSLVEHRTKRINDALIFVDLLVQPPPQIAMTNRSITTKRKVYFDFLEQENFHIGQWFQNQRWKRFCSLEVPIYLPLVHSFFENLRLSGTYIESTVKGQLIVLDENQLSSLLEMPKEGICFLHLIENLMD